jgi:hypothetical protein
VADLHERARGRGKTGKEARTSHDDAANNL